MADTTPISNALNLDLANKLNDMPVAGGDNGVTASTSGTVFSASQRNLALANAYNELAVRLILKYGKDASKVCEGLVATQSVIFSSSGTTINSDYIAPITLLDSTLNTNFALTSLNALKQDLDPYLDAGYAIEASKLYAYLRGVSGTIADIQITGGGSGYVGAPLISFSGGGGTGAAATATITGGVVTSINITNRGSGYTSAPTVVFDSGAAAATAVVGSGSLIILHSNTGTLYYIKSDRKSTTTGAPVAVNTAPDTTIDQTWLIWCAEYAAWWLATNKGTGRWNEKAQAFAAQVELKLPK